MRHKLSCALICISIGACTPGLGDACTSANDCSVQRDRVCDRSQPGGYCTILNCEPGDCGDEGYCVRFQPDELRLSRTFCMAKCSNNSDCDREAYVCRSAEQLNEGQDEAVAEVIDSNSRGKFCVVSDALASPDAPDADAGVDAAVEVQRDAGDDSEPADAGADAESALADAAAMEADASAEDDAGDLDASLDDASLDDAALDDAALDDAALDDAGDADASQTGDGGDAASADAASDAASSTLME